MKNIRNFAIIAHVDHGKSTLADRLLELTGVVDPADHEEQLLDKNPISRERGITIKLAPVKMKCNGMILDLIDTPGHVDFSYEVERTLACVEGVILLVDATQGIQAQTIAHTYKAMEQDLVIIPVVNKIDLPHAQVDKVKKELAEFLGITDSQIFEISAKTGVGVENLLDAVIHNVPPPQKTIKTEDDNSKVQRALIFDSYYDKYRGVIAFVRIFDGSFRKGSKVRLWATNIVFEIAETGVFSPDLKEKDNLTEGEIGYIITNLKDIHQVQVGDTMLEINSRNAPLSGYRKVQPMVFSSMFPTDPDEYVNLIASMEKLTLNDSALTFEPVYSRALGSGLRVGFLGLLHADVVRQRLEREFSANIILTSPQVEYKTETDEPDSNMKVKYKEPIAKVNIVTPPQYLGIVMKLAEDSRGIFLHMDNKSQVQISYEIPMAELVGNFFDKLKTITSGYASLEWEFKEYRSVDADKLTIMLNQEPVDEFSEYVVAERSYERAIKITSKLKELIPRQQYEVRIQAKYKGKIIASSRIVPFRKDVTAGLYGGDRSRKDKLLKKQKKGKKLLKNVGSVEIPKEVFLKLFQNT